MNQTSSQPTSTNQNKTWSPPWICSGKLYFQGLYLIAFRFQLNRNVFHRYDGEFFVRNLESSVDNSVKRGKPPQRIRYLHYCTWAYALMVRNDVFLIQCWTMFCAQSRRKFITSQFSLLHHLLFCFSGKGNWTGGCGIFFSRRGAYVYETHCSWEYQRRD